MTWLWANPWMTSIECSKHSDESTRTEAKTASANGNLSVKQIAGELDVTTQTVRNWLKSGLDGILLKSYKRGGKRFILREDLDSFLRETTHEGFEEKPQDRTPAQFQTAQKKARKVWDRFNGN